MFFDFALCHISGAGVVIICSQFSSFLSLYFHMKIFLLIALKGRGAVKIASKSLKDVDPSIDL